MSAALTLNVRPSVLRRSWVAVLGIALIVASDYSWRQREQDESLSGRLDIAILLELAIFGVVGAFLVLELLRPERTGPATARSVTLWGFCMAMAVAATYSPFRSLALSRSVQLLIVATFSAMIARHARREHLHRLCHAYLVMLAVSVAIGLLFPFPRLELQASRFNWLYVHPVIAGTLLSFGVVIAAFYISTHGRRAATRFWSRRVYAALLAVDVVALLATRTRTAMAAALIGTVVAALAGASRKRRTDGMVVVAIVVAVGALLFSAEVVEFVGRGEGTESITTLNSRTDVWDQGWDLFLDRPLFGYGFMAARGVFLESFGLGGAHNALFEVLLNAGVVGAAAWLALMVVTTRSTFRLPSSASNPVADPDGPLLKGLMALLLVSSLTTGGTGQAANAQNVWLFVLVAWVAVAAREGRARDEDRDIRLTEVAA